MGSTASGDATPPNMPGNMRVPSGVGTAHMLRIGVAEGAGTLLTNKRFLWKPFLKPLSQVRQSPTLQAHCVEKRALKKVMASPLWVISDIRKRFRHVRFTPRSGHAVRRRKESAMCQKRTSRHKDNANNLRE